LARQEAQVERKMKDLITIQKAKRLEGEIRVPGDKSISHRGVILGALIQGDMEIKGFLDAEDCMNTVRALKALGVKIEGPDCGTLLVHGQGPRGLIEPGDVISLGNSGTGMRLLTGVLAAQDFYTVLTGDSSLRQRPMGRIIKPLRMMGAKVFGRAQDTLPPLTIMGNASLSPITYSLPVASAQVKSCLLLAGIFCNGETVLTEPSLSRDHTERMLKFLGAEIGTRGLTTTLKGPFLPKGDYSLLVPGDISAAAFFITAACILPGSSLKILDVGLNATRCGLLKVLKEMGGRVRISAHRVVNGEEIGDLWVGGSDELQGVTIKGDIVPSLIDEIPAIAVAATQAKGVTEIRDARELRVKETDRIKALTTELRKMGAKIRELKDGLVIEGKTPLKGSRVSSFGDHRMAMALAVAGLSAQGKTEILKASCIDTSFPRFFEILKECVRWQ
jgi:3-phosphoshikimate 1-carboxyvinyltransferase